jgi:AraC-like DNA-binding protein
MRRIHARTIWLQYEISLAHGLDEREIARLGLCQSDLAGPDATVPASLVYAHLELVAARTSFERFTIDLARRHTSSSLGLFGFALKSASHGRAALACMRRYQHVTNTLATFDVIEHDRGATFVEHRFGPVTPGHRLATEVSLLGAIQIWRELFHADFSPRSVHIRRAGADTAVYEQFCGCPVLGSAERGCYEFDPALFDRPLRTADADMAEYFDHVLAQRARATGDEPSVIGELRRQLAQKLPDGVPPMSETARLLGTSVRTLQRRLRAEGASFGSVLDHVRADLALAYLQNRNLTTAEIAYLLGYAEASSFSRAFRRWHGRTPEEHRAAYQPSAFT